MALQIFVLGSTPKPLSLLNGQSILTLFLQAGGDSKTCICQSDSCNETFETAEPETTTKTPETATTIPETVNNTVPSNLNETILQCYQCGKQRYT